MNLTTAQKTVLQAMSHGDTLKTHRYFDGTKVCRLHPLNSADGCEIDTLVVNQLKALGLISSNMKFPAATYLLTQKGLDTASALTDPPTCRVCHVGP